MKTFIVHAFVLPAQIAGLNLIPAGRLTAQTFRTLHSFTATVNSGPPYPSLTNSDGAEPWGELISNSSGNTLYGTAKSGGNSGDGAIFAVNTDGTAFTNLHSLAGSDGVSPYGLTLSGSTLYGTALNGRIVGVQGTVYSLSFRLQPTIAPSGTNVILSWPTKVAGFDYTGYNLQSTTNLVSPAVWSTSSPAPVIVNGLYTVTNHVGGPEIFYRLMQ